ncbi:class I SAM-dependent methyltransferase [Citricoccus sp.]|uniref:class I SAM-dependent methyltransferase n=1 Tax=Citricoccus sp. TaxID=1978372 RepID=UPI0028BECC9B|nr:class I SAM-dependent methyltransferase [Citricoccus sp.]
MSTSATWWSANGRPAPQKLVVVDDRLTTVQAVKYAAQGSAMLWLGDFHNAKQILSAIDRRLAKGKGGAAARPVVGDAQAFYRLRQARAQRSRMMSLILVPLAFDAPGGAATVPLPRAPQVGPAVEYAYAQQPGFGEGNAVVSLQELSGVQSAYQWYLTGIEIPALKGRIHPHYGTFLPTRHEYLDLVAQAPLVNRELAFDVGTGTGVLAAVLVHRGVRKVVGTDLQQRAVDCANETFARLGVQDAAEAQLTSMFPAGRAPLIVCNPPWLPGSAATTLDAAVYDPGSTMLLQFLKGLPDHLTDDGEGWLILSDLAELLGLRSRQLLMDAIDQAGLEVIDRLDTTPRHQRASDRSDPLHAARSREVTSLWRLRAQRPIDASEG